MRRLAQRACRGGAGYVAVTARLMPDHGRAVAATAHDLGPDEATVHRYARAHRASGLTRYLAAGQPG